MGVVFCLVLVGVVSVQAAYTQLEPIKQWPEGSDGVAILTKYPKNVRCAACRTVVEQFGMYFSKLTLTANLNIPDATSPPMLTYNDEMEQQVVKHCLEPSYLMLQPWAREMCETLLLGPHKPQFIAPFLGAAVGPTKVQQTIAIALVKNCVELYGLCPPPTPAKQIEKKNSNDARCLRCIEVVKDIDFSIDRLRRPISKLDIGTTVGSVCDDVAMRHRMADGRDMIESTCHSILNEHDDDIVQFYVQRLKQGKGTLTPAGAKSPHIEICYSLLSHCVHKQKKDL